MFKIFLVNKQKTFCRRKRWEESERKLDFFDFDLSNKIFLAHFLYFFLVKFQNKMGEKNGRFYSGVIEGFYHRPWTMEQRLDLFKKMKKFSLNSYLYAPKEIKFVFNKSRGVFRGWAMRVQPPPLGSVKSMVFIVNWMLSPLP